MVKIRKVDVSVMDRPAPTRGAAKELTPAQRERQAQQRQFTRLMGQLSDPETVFEVRLGRDEKPVTIRQRLLRAAQDAGKEVAVRKSPNGFVVGLMTPERRSNRGRKKASASA
jgi:hypothetical protein